MVNQGVLYYLDQLKTLTQELIKNDDIYNEMIEKKKKYISSSSAKDLVDFIKNKYEN